MRTAKLQMVTDADVLSANPDERRAWETHSLIEDKAFSNRSGHFPRRSNLLHINTGFTRWFSEHRWLDLSAVLQVQVGTMNASPLFNTAQHIRAFFAAMATTALQYPRRAARATAHRLTLSVFSLEACRTERAPSTNRERM